jgi:hypothetical protein
MSMVSESLYWKVSALLDSQRSGLERYRQLLETQRAALRDDDIDLLADLAADAAELAQELAAGSRNLVIGREQLSQRQDPRHQALGASLDQFAGEAEQVLAITRDLLLQAGVRREASVRSIMELDSQSTGQTGKNYLPVPGNPAFLDRSA